MAEASQHVQVCRGFCFLVFVCGMIVAAATSIAEVEKVYWVSSDTTKELIARADATNGAPAELIIDLPDADNPQALNVSRTTGKIYWGDETADVISRADLDGSNIEANFITGQRAYDIVVAGDYIYWVGLSFGVRRADLADGGNVTDIATPKANARSEGIDVDLVNGKIYWSDYNGTQAVYRCNLDGSDVEVILDVDDGLAGPWGVAVDGAGGKVYWSDFTNDELCRANLDGSDRNHAGIRRN